MKTNDAVLEFLVPGMVVWIAFLIGLAIIGLADGWLLLSQLMRIGAGLATLVITAVLPIAYMTGALMSELGTVLLSSRSDSFIGSLVETRRDDFKTLGIPIATTPNYRDFAALRAACRAKPASITKRLQHHESVLRLYRPASVAVPIAVVFLVGAAHWVSETSPGWGLLSVIVLIGLPIGVWYVILQLFLQRMESCFFSCLNSLLPRP